MKRIALIFTALIFVLTVSAQDVTKSIGKNASNVTYTGVASDTITNTDTWTIQFGLSGKVARYGYNLMVVLDSISGTPADACTLAGSQDGSTWTTIGSAVSWTGTTSDTTFYYSDVATGVLWRYLHIAIKGTGTQKAKVNKIYGKIGDL